MQGTKLTHHEVKVYEALILSGTWLTAAELAEVAGIAARTANRHARNLANLGVAERASVAPAYKYRIRPDGNLEYVRKLENARSVFVGL